jgi:uncharacterized damage-inducible protein DinB
MPPTLLATRLQGWTDYQTNTIRAIAPLTAEQLALRVVPHLRSVGEIASHMATARASWFHKRLNEGTPATAPLLQWWAPGAPARTAADIVGGLEVTWGMLQDALARWTPEELARPFPVTLYGQARIVTRQWVVWHLLEHDLHHGGELAYMLGMHGLPAPEI